MRARRALSMAGAVVLVAGCGIGQQSAESVETTTTTATTAPPMVDSIDLGKHGRIDADWVGDGPKVAVLGDSIAHLTREELAAALPGYSLRVAAVVGEGWGPGEWSDNLGYDVIEPAAVQLAAEAPEVVVWVLGTNDSLDPGRSSGDAVAEIREMADRFSSSCIVAVEVHEHMSDEDFSIGEAALINEVLDDVADVTVTPDPATLEPDGIHPARGAEAAWVEPVADAVRSCG